MAYIYAKNPKMSYSLKNKLPLLDKIAKRFPEFSYLTDVHFIILYNQELLSRKQIIINTNIILFNNYANRQAKILVYITEM